VVSCNGAEYALVSSLLFSQQGLHTIPVAEVGQNLHVEVGLRLKKIIELVKHNEILNERLIRTVYCYANIKSCGGMGVEREPSSKKSKRLILLRLRSTLVGGLAQW